MKELKDEADKAPPDIAEIALAATFDTLARQLDAPGVGAIQRAQRAAASTCR